ncbi:MULTISPECIES: zinc-binding dehydrogenase [unclassified Pseudodesulfovibrio]|uniref:zinc-binding dehydrogenase n=1 Tax=unclassified Pseudodesulfovibrio TaxID=2661612 RepID=UPI000FEBA8C6|nr:MULTISPECIES: zinc-binding dehydrogenase [unclassified Pseudodesulfovibrio]MCJ2163471.1 zinc-binding dehydrogenase [Pseudodesulfovibrio sp. S3-i]RWU06707.1 quinone oxidoreductase [Pseudodesulfovibrio sp. S3]
MKAMLLERYGADYAFAEHEVPCPEPGPGEVLIKVAGTSLNPIDNKIVTLGQALPFAPELPALLGMDVSGTVEALGQGASRFRAGERVFGCAGGLKGLPGALAEYMVADQRLLARAPECMELEDAAAMPLVAITAWLALFGKASVSRGQRLLVHGGAGGVGHMAVQLGTHVGAEVFATVSSPDKAAVVEALGGIPIDYRAMDVPRYVDEFTAGVGFDVVFDTVGGVTLDQSFAAARTGGQVVSTVTRSTHDLSPLHAKSLSLHVVFMLLPMITGLGRSLHGEILSNLSALVDEDALAVLIDERRFNFRDIEQAHRYWEKGEALGKICVTVGK